MTAEELTIVFSILAIILSMLSILGAIFHNQ